MTIEDIINEIRYILSELDNGEDAVSYLTQNDVKWLNENIKALEQKTTTKIEESNFSQEQYLADLQSAYDCGKSVIDKIRAEIADDWHLNIFPSIPFSCGLRRAMEIIDKYKAESESK